MGPDLQGAPMEYKWVVNSLALAMHLEVDVVIWPKGPWTSSCECDTLTLYVKGILPCRAHALIPDLGLVSVVSRTANLKILSYTTTTLLN